jgi:hypothetical protein
MNVNLNLEERAIVAIAIESKIESASERLKISGDTYWANQIQTYKTILEKI